MKIISFLKKFLSPGTLKGTFFYSILTTCIILFLASERSIMAFFAGSFFAVFIAFFTHLELGLIIKYIAKNGSMKGIRKGLPFPFLVNGGLTLLTAITFFIYFRTFTEPVIQLWLPVAMTVGVIIPNIDLIIFLRTFFWNWNPNKENS